MRRAADHPPVNVEGLVDTCGTGGDEKGRTFNISTTVAFVVAGAGIPVISTAIVRSTAKPDQPRRTESALGISISLTAEQVADCINSAGSVLCSPNFHPSMKHAVVGVRQASTSAHDLPTSSGPLTNPAGETTVTRQSLLPI
ncbi:MAG: hypothetical protein U0528_11025 [Anaerolineae bacterium]